MPIALRHSLHAQLMIGHEGIGNAAQGREVSMDEAGHLGRQPLVGANLAEMPRASQRLSVQIGPLSSEICTIAQSRL